MSEKEEEPSNSFKKNTNDIDDSPMNIVPISSSTSPTTTSASSAGTNDFNFIERISPKVLFVGSSLKLGSNQFASKDLPLFLRQELGVARPPGSVNKGIHLEQSGLEKFKKYIELHRTFPDVDIGESASRRITGQEDPSELGKSTVGKGSSYLHKELKKLTLRPPVLGRASSSSNDSGSAISGSSENEYEDVQIDDSAVGLDNVIVFSEVNLAAATNREDYISEKPPEGSSDLSSLGIQEQPPSSASSVASVSLRPLEWDSGADVGYYQIYSSNNSGEKKLSTIERMAIATGSAALLTRSDPEGTTEYGGQMASTIPSNKSLKKDNIKDRLGIPVAESTPFSTAESKSDTTSRLHVNLGSNEFSPIIAPNPSEHLGVQTAIDSNANHTPNQLPFLAFEREVRPCPLFPEIISSHPSPLALNNSDRACYQPSQKISLSTSITSSSYFKPLGRGDNTVGENSELVAKEKQNTLINECNNDDRKASLKKQISSSMEHLRDNDIPKLPRSNRVFNTLPRSQSHSNISVEVSESYTFPKYLLQSHNPVKSASSSSISTVVQRRKDSPKHISKLVQTSVLNQSIGIQATGSETTQCPIPQATSRSQSNSKNDSLKFESITPKNLSSNNSLSTQNFKYSKHSQMLHSHKHDGTLCTGAHKKVFGREGTSKHESIEKNHPVISKDVLNSGSNSLNCRDGISGNRIDVKGSKMYNNEESGTLDSITSSVKTEQHTWADGRECLGVEDRANSFEYLPGHMYETVARPDDASGESSSISLNRNASSQNEMSDEAEKSWNVSNSSTFLRDIERGVNMMIHFVENSQVNSTELKKKLMKRVAEKLIVSDLVRGDGCNSKNSSSAGTNSLSEARLGEIRNGRETRRSLVKDRPPQESPSTTDRTSSRTSSECFRPKPSFPVASSHKLRRELQDKCIGTEFTSSLILSDKEQKRVDESNDAQCESTSSNEKSRHNSKNPSRKFDNCQEKKETREFLKQQTVYGKKRQPTLQRRLNSPESPITLDSNRSSSVDHSTEWRSPTPISEGVSENKRKSHVGKIDTRAMIDYLSVERENHRLMIQAEIEHLDNLKRLLEKQEELRVSLTRIQKSRKCHRSVVADDKSRTTNECHTNKKPSCIRNGMNRHVKSDRNYLNTIEELQDWDSHHYSSSADEMSKEIMKETNESNLVTQRIKNNENGVLGNKLITDSKVHTSEVKSARSDSSKDGENSNGAEMKGKTCKPVETGGKDFVTATRRSFNDSQAQERSLSSDSKKSQPEKIICKCKNRELCRCLKRYESLEKSKKSVAYFITFEEKNQGNNTNTNSSFEEAEKIPNKNRDNFSNKIDLKRTNRSSTPEKENRKPKQSRKTLQEYLLMNRGDYVNRAEYRRKCVAELTFLRELRNKSKRHLIVMAPESSDYSQSSTPRELPPPPLAVKRVFSQRTMRRQTERKYRQLAEVQNKQIDMKRKESYRTNRLMAEVFKKKLKRRVLNGEVNLSNSVSVISSL